jgi:hypothetical protein
MVVREETDMTDSTDIDLDEELFFEPLDEKDDGVTSETIPPEVLGELSVSGDMPDPESDDDTLLNSHEMGLRLDEDYENPLPLDIARDIAAAEAARRGIRELDDDDDED